MRKVTMALLAALLLSAASATAHAAPLQREPGQHICVQTRYPNEQRCSRPQNTPRGERPQDNEQQDRRVTWRTPRR